MLKKILSYFFKTEPYPQPDNFDDYSDEDAESEEILSEGNLFSSPEHLALLKYKLLILSEDYAFSFTPKIKNDFVLIRIKDPHSPWDNKELDQRYHSVLKVNFFDVTYMKDEDEISQDRWWMEMTTAAPLMLSFIKEHLDKNIVIHCQAGISRSAGVAAFISELRSDKAKDFILKHEKHWEPNYWIQKALKEAEIKENKNA